MHPPHQAGHAGAVAEGRGRLRLRIVLVRAALHAQQAAEFVLLGLGLMHPRPAAGLPGEHPAAIDLDHGQLWRALDLGRQLPAAVPDGVGVAAAGQFGADFLGQAADLTRADVQAAGHAQGLGRLCKGVELGSEFDDLAQQGGAITVPVQAESRPQGGKSPGGSRDSGTQARWLAPGGRL
jgi:hypothetical protein